jgi:hypothetical protein
MDFSCASSSVHRGVFIGKGKTLFASWKGYSTFKIGLLLFVDISFINLPNVFRSTFCERHCIGVLGGTCGRIISFNDADASLVLTFLTVVVATVFTSRLLVLTEATSLKARLYLLNLVSIRPKVCIIAQGLLYKRFLNS